MGASFVQYLHIGREHIFNPYPANVENMVAPTNASKWRMVFNSAFKGLIYVHFEETKKTAYCPSTIWIYISPLRLRIPLFGGGGG